MPKNVFMASQGSGMMHHIRLGLGAGTPNVVIQNNVFESSSSTGDNWIYGIRSEASGADLHILGNSIQGGSNSAANAIWGIYLDSGAGVEVRRNTIDMGLADVDSVQYAMDIRGSGPQASIESNRIRMQLTLAQQNTGISLYRPALVANNVIVQEGAASGTSGFKGIDTYSTGAILINNTIANRSLNDGNTALIRANNGAVSGLVATNNILWADDSAATGIRNDDSLNPAEINNNLFFSMPIAYYSTATSGVLAANLAMLGYLNNQSLDPMLNTTGTIGDPIWYSYDAASPAILATGGSTAHLGIVPFDILKFPRIDPVGIGAYQGPIETLVARWQFVSGTELQDSTVYGSVLAPTGSPVFGVLDSRRFAQFTATTDQLSAGPTPAINQSIGGQTISFWIYGNVLNQGTMLSRYDELGNTVWRVGSLVDTQLNVMDPGIDGKAVISVGSVYDFGGALVANQWNHVAVVLTTGSAAPGSSSTMFQAPV